VVKRKEVIGPRMLAAARIVYSNGGTMAPKHALAQAVGPNGSNAFGDRIVMRAVRAGLLRLEGSERRYTVVLTDKGRALVEREPVLVNAYAYLYGGGTR
jgi:hypothetical protein